MDGLKLAQMATLLAMSGQGAAARDPGSKALNESLIGSGQSATMAEAKKKAEKKAKKGSGVGKLLGTAVPLVAAPFTGGASLAWLPTSTAAGGALDSAIAGDMNGVVQNGVDAGMGYMMSKSMMTPTPAPTPAPAPAPVASPPSLVSQGAPDPMMAPSNMQVKPLSAPAASTVAPAAPPAPTQSAPPPASGGGKSAPIGPMSSSSIIGPALVGLTAAGISRGVSNQRAAKTGAPPRSGPSGEPNFRTNMAPNAATMTPAQIRRAPEVTKLAMQPTSNGDWGSGQLTKAQARSLGMSPEAIQEGIRNGTIIDDGSAGDFLKTAAGGAALAHMMKA